MTWLRLAGSWAILGILLFSILIAAISFDRASWPTVIGDEATYLMQAESLAWDFDLTFGKLDYDRFVRHWRNRPDLVLQSGDSGEHVTFGKPFLYALAIAPFVRAAPRRGAVVANAVFFAASALAAASALRKRRGPAAPLWVATYLFASVAFGHVFWVHSDLLLMATTAVAFSLAYGDPELESNPSAAATLGGDVPRLRCLLRWVTVGLLLSVSGTSRPFYFILLLPAGLAVPARHRRLAWCGLAAGALSLLLAVSLIHHTAGRSWSPYTGERRGFTDRTGYPGIDFPSEQWSEAVRQLGSASWIHEGSSQFQLDSALWRWNSFYFLLGRNVGVLPYFLPLVLGFFAGVRGREQWAIVVAVVLVLACFFAIRPFNFYGGGGALANRYFLPIYPAFWFLGFRPARVRWAVAVAALTMPFLWPLWSAPRAYPVIPFRSYRHVSALAARWLPHETTQKHLRAIGRDDVAHNQLWVRFLNEAVWPEESGKILRLRAGADGEILVGSPSPLTRLRVEVSESEPVDLEIPTDHVEVERHNGVTAYRVVLPRPSAKHPMWWTRDDVYLYRLPLRMGTETLSVVSFSLHPDP
jgi:hypothetical protein